ncbi:hypothetical protein AVL59_32110 [Streptomyces griseochromogenes]|uniref:Uncharacterized protein n=1 Tax=Streptomyces griseochromogenes TaxID=68214 RepID=A0A1B1B494_9ACTN|nr:hypothetical protein AVL59_32110 [Streptomyces griseochromogenes]
MDQASVAEWTHTPWVARTTVGFKSVATSLLPTEVVGTMVFNEHADAKIATVSGVNSYAYEPIGTGRISTLISTVQQLT